MAIFYLSFADDSGWLGCIHTEAKSFGEALLKTHALGINPGGEVVMVEVPSETFAQPEGARILQLLDQYLTMGEMQAIFGEHEMVRFGDEEIPI